MSNLTKTEKIALARQSIVRLPGQGTLTDIQCINEALDAARTAYEQLLAAKVQLAHEWQSSRSARADRDDFKIVLAMLVDAEQQDNGLHHRLFIKSCGMEGDAGRALALVAEAIRRATALRGEGRL